MWFKAIAIAGLVVVGGLFSLIVASYQPTAKPPASPSVVADVGLWPMLEEHQDMTEQMRVSGATPRMVTQMETDPVYGDWSEDMARYQEAYQAQIDRMLARR